MTAGQNPPPWMQGKKKPEDNPMMNARKTVAQKRLAKLKGQTQPKGK